MNQNEQLQVKLDLEKRLMRKTNTLFNRINREFVVGVAVDTGIRATDFQAAWDAMFSEHYRIAQFRFRDAVQNNSKQDDQHDELLLLAALAAWIAKNAPEAAAAVSRTTQNNMDRAVQQARQAFADSGVMSYTARELSLAAAAILGRMFRGRAAKIATTETQAGAESAKLMTAYSIANRPPMAVVTGRQVPDTDSKKEWIDVGDNAVRSGHRSAQVPTVSINVPFRVNGESLMYPGDNSRGATAGNRINCRCSSYYTFK